MTNTFIIKFGWNRTETVGEVAFWNFSSHRVSQNLKVENVEERKQESQGRDILFVHLQERNNLG